MRRPKIWYGRGPPPTARELIDEFAADLREREVDKLLAEARARQRQPSKPKAWVIAEWRNIKKTDDPKPMRTLVKRYEKKFEGGKVRNPQARESMKRNLRRWVAEAEGRKTRTRTKKRT